MPVAMLSDVLSRARSHLNDDDASSWPDTRLVPKARQAFDELQIELLLNGIPIINSITVVLSVPASAADDTNYDMSAVTNYPTDMILPTWMKERSVGEMNTDFVDMKEVDFIPNVTKGDSLLYWSWYKQTILLRGATMANEVQLRYKRLLTNPSLNTDSVVVLLAETYLSYRVASLAMSSIGMKDREDSFNFQAKENLDKLVRINVKQMQNTPVHRQPYGRRKYHGGRGYI